MNTSMSNPKTEIILALDAESRTKAEEILDKTGEELKWVKIGLQTYLRDGKSLFMILPHLVNQYS